jgi:rifampicin phosphotransferase
VEWCYDGKIFWIVQSRPITTHIEINHSSEIEWTRANLREVLPDLTSPQALFALREIIETGYREHYGKLVGPEDKYGPICKIFYGRMYFNLTQFRYVCFVIGAPPATFLRSIGHEGDIKPEDELIRPRPFKVMIEVLPTMLRLGWGQLTMGRMFRQFMARLNHDIKYYQRNDTLKALMPNELFSEIKRWGDSAPEYMKMVFSLTGLGIYQDIISKICKRLGLSEKQLVYTHLAAGEKSVSAQQAFDLLTLSLHALSEDIVREYFLNSSDSFTNYREDLAGSEFLKHFDAFLELYGHRGIYESDWALPRYKDDPSPLLFAVRMHVQSSQCPDPKAIVARQEEEAINAWNTFIGKLSWWQRLMFVPLVQWSLKRLKQMYLWRELFRSEMVKGLLQMRLLHFELADRFIKKGWISQRDDYFWLTLDEIEAGLLDTNKAESFQEIISKRRDDYATWQNLDMPILMRESELLKLTRRKISNFETDAPTLHGLCVSTGFVEGEVIVMRDPSQFGRMKKGAILVAPATDPSWTPLFTLASGVIVEVGGMLSHASTVAREYGLPALANIKNATKILKDGDLIRLDATNENIQIIKRL